MNLQSCWLTLLVNQKLHAALASLQNVISESEEERSSLRDVDERQDLDDLYNSEVEILDCIPIAM